MNAIGPNDICSLEASDRTNYWELTLWPAGTGERIVLATFHDRDRQHGVEMAAKVAETVLGWMSADGPTDTYDSDVHGPDDLLSPAVTVEQRGTRLVGRVHLGVTDVFKHEGDVSDYPAGLGDFAGITARRYAERLAALLDPGSTT